MKSLKRILSTTNMKSLILIRLIPGCVFLSEGIQKFLFPDSVGAGRFAKIGFSNPEFLAHFVGVFEIMCGIFLLLGLVTRLAAIPLTIVMLTALATTKWPIFLEHGFWKMAHDARTDFAMLISLIFLFVNGAGTLSLDFLIANRREKRGT